MTWIKICGTTNLEDARLAVEAGADALGFVFAESPRRVTPEQAREIIADLPEGVEKVGVFVDETVERIRAIIDLAGLTAVQLHGEGFVQPGLRRQLGADRPVKLLYVWRLEEFPPDGGFGLEIPADDDKPYALLLDSRSSRAKGGTGASFDWKMWAQFLSSHHLRQTLPRLIVAGGLRPHNVRDAIRLVCPWGVDVVTGVEHEPGRKDPQKVRAFVAAVRAAEGEVLTPPGG
jgi:phosphoribosylanthranilate isomerase